MGKYTKPVSGDKYGRWVVINDVGMINNDHIVYCLCECGIYKNVIFASLKSGVSRSCGCLNRENSSKASKKHGFGGNGRDIKPSKLYSIWNGIKGRCNPNGKNKSYKRYRELGIKMCDGWRSDFIKFANDMGDRPSDEYSIDRVNNNGNYSCGKCQECIRNKWPMNCRWATRKTQQNNISSNVYVNINGEIVNTTEAARILGVPKLRIWRRIKDGWSPEDAVSTPLYGNRNKMKPIGK